MLKILDQNKTDSVGVESEGLIKILKDIARKHIVWMLERESSK